MSSYHGREREELRVAGEEMNEASAMDILAQDYPISSFTPVNLGQVQAQYINPFDMHHEQPIDAFPDNPPEVPAKKSTKRPAAKANVGRTHSIGAVWEFQDEGDLGNEAQQDQHPPKRRKSAPPKRSIPAKTTSQPPPKISAADAECHSETQNIEQDQQNSQLTTPPDSAKRTKSKPGPKSKKPQLPPFKSLTVTKQVSKKEKEPANDHFSSSSAVKSQLGWTTTQDVVKLAKTTLDKLAAFQYKAPSHANLQDPVCSIVRNTSTHSIAGIRPSMNTEDAHAPSSSDYGSLPNSDSCFIEACPNTGANDTFNGQSILDVPQDTHLQTEKVRLVLGNSLTTSRVGEFQTNALRADTTVSSYSNDVARNSESPCKIAAQVEPSQEVPHSDEPTSSEVEALDDLIHGMEMNTTDKQLAQEEPRDCDIRPDEISSEMSLIDQSAFSYIVSSEFESTESTLPGQEPIKIHQVFESIIHPQSVHNRQPRPEKDIQIERPDDDRLDFTQRDVSKDFELDEFDEGVDDSDLLGLASDAILPDTKFYRESVPQQDGELSDTITSPLRLAETRTRPGFHQQEPLTTKTVQAYRVITKHESSAAETPEPDDEDEFPVDAADEAMMLEAAGAQIIGVVETFEPPESLRHLFDDSESLEVFDSSLQFSPPKPQHPVLSPHKTASDSGTDNISKPQSPDLEPPAMGEEENWTFIRRRGADVDIPSETEEEFRCSVVDLTPERLMTDFLKPQNTQQATDSTTHILGDSHEYLPLKAFIRPDLPALIIDRSPIVGVSTQSFLRVCFRVAEMFMEGGRCNALGQDAIIELYAKVIFSTREAGTTRQRFQFGDIFFDKPPFADGVLMNCKTTGLAESESKIFIGKHQGKLARCLGRLKRDRKTASGWMLHIITIRETDWEEIRWTKRIVSAGLVKSETPKL